MHLASGAEGKEPDRRQVGGLRLTPASVDWNTLMTGEAIPSLSWGSGRARITSQRLQADELARAIPDAHALTLVAIGHTWVCAYS
jgi:hypothetical protein